MSDRAIEKDHFSQSNTTNQQTPSEIDEARHNQVHLSQNHQNHQAAASQQQQQRNLHGLQSLSTLGGITGQTISGYGSSRRMLDEANYHKSQQQQIHYQQMGASNMSNIQQQQQHRGGAQQQNNLSPSSMGFGLNSQQQLNLGTSPHENDFFNPKCSNFTFGNQVDLNNRVQKNYLSQEDNELIQLVLVLPSEVLDDSLKGKVINLLKQKDKGVRGALISYQDDNDLEALRNRIIQKILIPSVSSNNMQVGRSGTLRSDATAEFQQTYHQQQHPNTATAIGRNRRRPGSYANRFMPIVLDLEQKQLIDEQTRSAVNDLLCEENVEVLQALNNYTSRVIADVELAFKLTRLAKLLGQQSYLVERPQSPIPKKKQDLMNQVNMLARYHFKDVEDELLLHKLIQEENEYILAVFDVYESDNNHENLIDSLQRILDKSKAQSINLSGFMGDAPQFRGNQSSLQQQEWRVTTPTAQYRNQQKRGSNTYKQHQRPPTMYAQERQQFLGGSHRFIGGRINTQDLNVSNHSVWASNMDNVPDSNEFKPATTVHDVQVIPGYFSSGEEDQVAQQHQPQYYQRQRQQSQGRKQNLNSQYHQHAQQTQLIQPVSGSSRHHIAHSTVAGGEKFSNKKNSRVSSNRYGASYQNASLSKIPPQNYNNNNSLMAGGNPMSNNTGVGGQTGGYQFSHMHQSMLDENDDVDGEVFFEPPPMMMTQPQLNMKNYNGNGEDLLFDQQLQWQQRRQQHHQHNYDNGYSGEIRRHITNHQARSSSTDNNMIGISRRFNPHHQPTSSAFYSHGKHFIGESKARSGANSISRNRVNKAATATSAYHTQQQIMTMSEEDDILAETTGAKAHDLYVRKMHSNQHGDQSQKQYMMRTHGTDYNSHNRQQIQHSTQQDQYSIVSNKFSGPHGSSIHKILNSKGVIVGTEDESVKKSKKKKDMKQKKTKSKKKKKGRSSSASSSSSLSSSSSSSSSSSYSSKSSKSSHSSKSSAEDKLERHNKKSKKLNKDSKKMKNKDGFKKAVIRLQINRFKDGDKDGKKDNKKGEKKDKGSKKDKKKDKIRVKQLREDSEDEELADKKKSKKNKKDKKRREKKEKKDKKSRKNKKRENPSVNNTNQSELGLNDRLASTTDLQYPDTKQIIQIMHEENIKNALQEDSYALLEHTIKQPGLDSELKKVFKVFIQNRDSNYLLSRVLSASEEMLHIFIEQNFSNSEISTLYNLRRSNSSKYCEAFQSFRLDDIGTQGLVAGLRQVIEIEQGSSLQTPVEITSSPLEGSIFDEKIEEIFQMVYESDFKNKQYGQILVTAFEMNRSTILQEIIKSYMSHNDYLRLKNEMTDFAKECQYQSEEGSNEGAEDVSQEAFPSMSLAIDYFVQQGNFTLEEGEILKQLYESKHKKLGSIWKVYAAIKHQEDLLNSLKVLMDIEAKNQQSVEAQNAIQRNLPPSSSAIENAAAVASSSQINDGLIRLNMMQGGEEPNQDQNIYANNTDSPNANDPYEMSNNAGEILDGGMDYPTEAEDGFNQEFDQVAQRLEQICRYSHKILKKYVVNGMITLQDGPQLHNLVDARDYRIICILEVYSQNKNEDDFLENLGLLTQVIKEQKEQEEKDLMERISFSGDEEFNDVEEVQTLDDSFQIMINEATSQNLIDLNAANWCVEQKKAENRRLVLSYNAYKKNHDLKDFAHTLSRLFTNAHK